MKKKFHGVKLSELDELEKLYKVKIHVYSLALTQNHREDNEDNESDIAAILICRSHRHYATTTTTTLYFTPNIQEIKIYNNSTDNDRGAGCPK